MKLNNEILIADLIEITRENLNQIEKFNLLSVDKLNWKETEISWSVLECIEHLNIYGEFYIPELDKQIAKASPRANDFYKTGVIGNYFVKLIQPKGKLKKMKTKKEFNPAGSNLNNDVLVKFKEQQFQLLEILSKASSVDLTKTKTAISISKLIKLRIGDTLRFVIYHNQRHLIQAYKVLSKHV